jgi:hypothetical protein
MDRIIRELVAIDQQARNQVCLAEEEQAQEKFRISQEKEELREQYARHIRESLENMRRETDKQFAEEFKRMEADYQNDLAVLETQFQDNGRQWAEDIVNRCLSV